MSYKRIAIFTLLLAGIGGLTAWLLTRSRPGELDIVARDLPELAALQFAANDWPCWRGPKGDNHSPDKEAPTSWSEKEHIFWKTPIPGRGHSTPILVGNRIFLTSADEAAQRQFALALDRDTGKILWEKTIHEKNLPHMHRDNSHASSTPVCDGERLFVAFANDNAVSVTALNLQGEVIWQKKVGPHGGGGSHGFGSSLAIWDKFVFVVGDSPLDGKGWIAGLHRQTGEGWRVGRKTGTGSYGSPIVAEFDGKPLLLIPGNGKVAAYDPNNGHLLWERGGLAEVSGNSVAISPTMIFASSGFPQRKLIALKADGIVAWKRESGSEIPYPPTMLWHKDHLYVLGDQGYLSCFNAVTGEPKWKERLNGSFYSSPLLVGDNLYFGNREGKTWIVAANPDAFVEVAKNELDRGINASPVAVGGKLYLRTATDLYCIGK